MEEDNKEKKFLEFGGYKIDPIIFTQGCRSRMRYENMRRSVLQLGSVYGQ
jgi:hypothetical protein